MIEGRLITTGFSNAALNMGIDEALARLSPVPVFRYYGWEPSAVSIGYFQRLEREVDLDMARRLGVDVVRRITGGGAVYHDRHGEVTYSVSLSRKLPDIPEDVLESYRLLCNGIIRGLAEVGLNTEFSPINDIVFNGKKLSGNAQTRRFEKVLQHGTILLRVDPEKMFSLLKVPDEKVRDKMIAAVEERVTSLEKEGVDADFETVGAALLNGFSQVLDIDFMPSELTGEELSLARELALTKYGSRGWSHRR